VDLPGAMETLEGVTAARVAAGPPLRGLLFGPGRFFDGRALDPVERG